MKSESAHVSMSASDLTREDLEKEKLRLEIEDLRRPWWRKPNHSLYTVVAFLTLGIGFLTQSYQANSARLETERAIFVQQKNDFELSRDPLHKKLDQTEREKEDYKAQLAEAQQNVSRANQAVTSKDQELASLRQREVTVSIPAFHFKPIVLPNASQRAWMKLLATDNRPRPVNKKPIKQNSIGKPNFDSALLRKLLAQSKS